MGEVLVIHYEDVVDTKMEEVEKILRFLDQNIDKRRMECMKYANLDFYKRNNPKLMKNPFSMIKNNVDIVNDTLVSF